MNPATIPIALTSIWQLNPACVSDIATRTWPDMAMRTRPHAVPAASNDDGDLHRRSRPERLPLPWPDRAGLFAAIAVAALCVFVWTVTLLSVDIAIYGRLYHALAFWALVAETGTALPAWLFLRFIDFMNDGPDARRKDALRRRIEPQFAADGMSVFSEPRLAYSKNATERTSML